MAKGRSPNYPQVTLEEALQRVRPLYEAAHTYPTDKRVIAENLGYSGLHGKSLTLIGALRRYNLLEQAGEGMRVSDDAVTLLELPLSEKQHLEALDRAAFAPRLFAQMHSEFGTNLPNDVTLRHYLIKQGFLPKAADEVIRVYRANLELVAGAIDAYNSTVTQPSKTSASPQAIKPAGIPSAEAVGVARISPPSQLGFKVEVSDQSVFVSYNGKVDSEVIDRLIKYLQITRDAFKVNQTSDAAAPAEVDGEIVDQE